MNGNGNGSGPREKLLVIGNGMSGARAVEEIVERGGRDRFSITVLGDEPYGNYNRISLSNVLAGSDDSRDIFLNSLAWYEENGITLHAGVRARSLDRFAKLVCTDDGSEHSYHKLIIATGSSPFFPPIDGMWTDDGLRPGAFGFRTLDDTEGMLSWAENSSRAVVIGGGLLGLEAARGLLERGLEVEVIHRAPRLMNVQLDEGAARVLQSAVEGLGIGVRLDASTTRVLGSERVEGIELEGGETIACDMVVVAAGIRPNVDIARRAGLTVERGIVVDDTMRAVDHEDIYIAGECAQHRGQVYGLVAPLWEQATVLADHITDADPRAAYHGSKLATKLKVSGIELATMGQAEPEHPDDEVVHFSEPGRNVYKTVIVRDGKLVGATLLGDVGKVSFLTQAFDRGTVLPEERVELLFDLGGPAEEVGISELGDDAQVCNCNGVSKGDIAACVRSGNRTVSGVMKATRAGTGCGSCKGQVLDIVEWAAGGALERDPTADYYVPAIPMSKPDLMAAVREQGLKSVSAVFDALAQEGEVAAVKPALASLLRLVWGKEYEDERDARFINDRVHGNIQKDGTFSVVPRISGGVTNADELRRIADVSDKYQIPMIKITGGQRIDLLGVRKEDLPAVWKDLDMPSGHAYGKSFRTVKTCVGSDFCRFGLGDSTQLGIRTEERFKGLESPAKIKMGVAGCPRNCSEAMVKDVGFVAVEGGRWEVYVGGAAGAHVRKGDLLCTVDDPDEAMRICGRFLQYYRENAKWLERTYTFCERIGLEELQALVVEDRDGIGERLDAAMEASIAAYSDPWREAEQPVTPNQFESVVSPA
ncbi:MAG: nitrite reductase large subunit NirB [Solirubrobacteraceae bacterium]